jgi:hypothetical protein
MQFLRRTAERDSFHSYRRCCGRPSCANLVKTYPFICTDPDIVCQHHGKCEIVAMLLYRFVVDIQRMTEDRQIRSGHMAEIVVEAGPCVEQFTAVRSAAWIARKTGDDGNCITKRRVVFRRKTMPEKTSAVRVSQTFGALRSRAPQPLGAARPLVPRWCGPRKGRGHLLRRAKRTSTEGAWRLQTRGASLHRQRSLFPSEPPFNPQQHHRARPSRDQTASEGQARVPRIPGCATNDSGL